MTQYERVPDSEIRAGDLVVGPRGRELCARLAGMPVWDIRHQDAWSSTGGVALVADEPAAADPVAVAELLSRDDDDEAACHFDRHDALAGVPVLGDVAEDVNCWGGFPAADPLEHPAVLAGIRATADMVAGAPGCQWWWSHLDLSAQRYVQWTARDDPDDDYLPPPRPGQAARMLRDGDRWAAKHEQSMHEYRRLPAGAGPGGPWWSCPFPATSRRHGAWAAWAPSCSPAGKTDSGTPRQSCGRSPSPSPPASTRSTVPPPGSTWSPPTPARPPRPTGTPGHGPAGTVNGSYRTGGQPPVTGTASTSPSPATWQQRAAPSRSQPPEPSWPDGTLTKPTGSPTSSPHP